MSRFLSFFLITVSLFVFLGCGDSNIFSSLNNDDLNADVATLTATAEKELKDGNYANAKKYYESIIAKDPKNSVAYYGLAAVAFKENGIDLAKILASVTENSTSTSSSKVAISNVGISATNIEQLINIDNLKDLFVASKKVVEYLAKIATGQCDGVIKATDVDVNVNLAIALVLESALTIMDSNGDGNPASTGDLVTVDKDYEILVNNKKIDDITNFSTELTVAQIAQLKIQLNIAINKILYAKQYIDIANTETKGKNSTIKDLLKSFDDLKVDQDKLLGKL